jgi:hypothetical protein
VLLMEMLTSCDPIPVDLCGSWMLSQLQNRLHRLETFENHWGHLNASPYHINWYKNRGQVSPTAGMGIHERVFSCADWLDHATGAPEAADGGAT